jgi:uncharacterized Rossmann fold enzyme
VGGLGDVIVHGDNLEALKAFLPCYFKMVTRGNMQCTLKVLDNL